MANEASQKGIEEILSSLNDNDLFALTATVTQGLLQNKIHSRQEALNAIIYCSPNLKSILRRKLITRDILFKYLHNHKISINLPTTKIDLIDKITTYWNLKLEEEENTAQTSATESHNKVTSETITLMAEQFSQWFYTMLNQSEGLGPEHFYSDAKLKLEIYVNGQIIDEMEDDGGEHIAQQLIATKTKYELYFNPNLAKEGVQGRMDTHGLVLVLSCGTLHSNDSCVGVFEQIFGLARDPFAENNWKIKHTQLILRSSGTVGGLPTLSGSKLTSGLLCLPSS